LKVHQTLFNCPNPKFLYTRELNTKIQTKPGFKLLTIIVSIKVNRSDRDYCVSVGLRELRQERCILPLLMCAEMFQEHVTALHSKADDNNTRFG